MIAATDFRQEMVIVRNCVARYDSASSKNEMANTLFPLIIFAIPLAIAVPVVILSFRLAKRRTQEFSDVAQQIGFKFLGSTWRGPALSPVHKMCIIQSTRGGFKNVMIGSIDGLE